MAEGCIGAWRPPLLCAGVNAGIRGLNRSEKKSLSELLGTTKISVNTSDGSATVCLGLLFLDGRIYNCICGVLVSKKNLQNFTVHLGTHYQSLFICLLE